MENRLNHERLIASLEELGKIGVGKDGQRNRLALSDGDKAARDLLCKWIKEAGLDLKIDPIGNIFGVLSGTEDGDPVIAGSHIDTVPNAGMFDGCVGVLSALEALRTIAGKKLPHRRSLAVAAWKHFRDPVAVLEIRADAGLDIGQTLIGMHLRRVAVPVRLGISQIGMANISAARTRPLLVGGERAQYV